jgi:very-short-patch-repair endonuclease
LDFFCEEARLAVEIDGGGHADPVQWRSDRNRDLALRKSGIRVLRFWNTEVYENLEGVLQRILEDVSPRR